MTHFIVELPRGPDFPDQNPELTKFILDNIKQENYYPRPKIYSHQLEEWVRWEVLSRRHTYKDEFLIQWAEKLLDNEYGRIRMDFFFAFEKVLIYEGGPRRWDIYAKLWPEVDRDLILDSRDWDFKG